MSVTLLPADPDMSRGDVRRDGRCFKWLAGLGNSLTRRAGYATVTLGSLIWRRSNKRTLCQRDPDHESRCVRRTRILYVAGLGRTGSTVLGGMLGGLPDVTFVGELSFFWRRFANGELCSCGQPLAACPFWSEVVRTAYRGLTPAQAQHFAEMERRMLRRQVLPGRSIADGDGPIRAMLNERARLYSAIAHVAQAIWIVDTGKNLTYGRLLARLDGVDFATIHIVRDPRGVAFSWLKHVRSDSEPGELDRRSAGNSAAHWVAQNLAMQWVLPRRSSTYLRVRYEELVTHPAEVVSAISSATGMTVRNSNELARYLAIRPTELHLVAGNPGVRARVGGGVPLTLDEEWRVGLPQAQRWTVTAICAGLMCAYGYPLRSTTIPRSWESRAPRLGSRPHG